MHGMYKELSERGFMIDCYEDKERYYEMTGKKRRT